MADESSNSRLTRTTSLLVVLGTVTGILGAGAKIFWIRHRLDTSLWLWTFLLIAVIMAISVPVAIWQQKVEKRQAQAPPWPQCFENPHFERLQQQGALSTGGTFQWTRESFARMKKDWMRYTPEGRSYRFNHFILYCIGSAGIAGALWALFLHEMTAVLLLLASLPMFALVFSARIRGPTEQSTNASSHWRLSEGRLVIQTAGRERNIALDSARALVRVPSGFIIWPRDLFEEWLPIDAFKTPEQLKSFSRTVASLVHNFVHEPDKE